MLEIADKIYLLKVETEMDWVCIEKADWPCVIFRNSVTVISNVCDFSSSQVHFIWRAFGRVWISSLGFDIGPVDIFVCGRWV